MRNSAVPAQARRVLLVGATGAFGSRLAERLSRDAGLHLTLAARDLHALEALAGRLRAAGACAMIGVQTFDRTRPDMLAALAPWLVADAAGPFQDSDYDLALAACAAGAHYVDLADGRAFVAGFEAAVGAAAQAAGVLAVTGASSTPALSHAALERLTQGWREVGTVRVVISPGARAPRGLSVMQAILSYVGQPVRVFTGGGWTTRPGWSGLHRPEMPGLGRRCASLCETPDLDLLPARFGVRREALFLAGLELPVMHLGLWAMAWVVRAGLTSSLRPLAPGLRTMAGALAWLGSDRGGMIVEAWGRDARGCAIHARWGLWADADAGPSTPAAPAAALIRALARDGLAARGAHVCTSLLPLDAITDALADLPIRTRIDAAWPEGGGLFRRRLGPAFDALAPAMRAVHDGRAPVTFAGRARVRAGRGVIARIVRLLIGLPRSGACPVEVAIAPGAACETWTRRFGDARFTSRLHDTPRLGVFEERIGPLAFSFRLLPERGGVRWSPEGCCVLGLPLPRLLAPRTRARARASGGAYRFSVVVAHPWTGLMFAYRGSLRAGQAGGEPSRGRPRPATLRLRKPAKLAL